MAREITETVITEWFSVKKDVLGSNQISQDFVLKIDFFENITITIRFHTWKCSEVGELSLNNMTDISRGW